jgi:hypothetical protein
MSLVDIWLIGVVVWVIAAIAWIPFSAWLLSRRT